MPVKVHELLYFKRPTTRTSYSDIPNENPDISRLLNGQKPFPSADNVMQKVPKKIIVDLGMRDSLQGEKLNAFDQRIQQLQGEGLSVYYYHNNQLNDYDINIMDNLTTLTKTPTAERLSQLLTIPVDELLILDKFFVSDSVFFDFFLSEFDAFADDLSEIFCLRSKEKIFSLIMDTHQELFKIDAFIGEFPTIKHLFLKNISYTPLPQLKHHKHLSALETFDLDLSGSDITSAQLAKILEELNIKVLTLNRCKNITDTFPEGMSCPELKELDLSHSSISADSFSRIMKHAPRLKVLKLRDCLMTGFFIEEFSFPELEILDVSSNQLERNHHVPYDCFTDILARTQKIKILNLKNYTELAYVTLPDGLLFPKLEEINFTNENRMVVVTMPILIDFLSKSPNLRRLNLDGCINIEGELPDGLDLSQLEELSIRGSSYSTPSLSGLSLTKILTQAKGLKKLNMANLLNYGEIPELCLPQLTDLNLYDCDISTQALTGLLLHGNHLKNLNLAASPNISEAVLNDTSFPWLKTLDLHGSSITENALYRMLSTARSLKSLSLCYCKNINDTLPDSLNLPELEELDLSNSTITNESLLKLISQSHKLKKLNLRDCNNLDATVITGLQRAGLEILSDKRQPDSNQSFTALPASQKNTANMDTQTTEQTFKNKDSNKLPPTLLVTYKAHNQKNSVDADTRLTEKTFKTERIFTGKPTSPQPRKLRYATFDGFSLNEQGGMAAPFILHNRGSELKPYKDHYQSTQPLYETYSKNTGEHYFCRTNLLLTSDWQALPSAFANEELRQFYTSPSADVELARSEHTSLYYIRLKNQVTGPQAITFEMILSRQKTEISFANLPEKIRDLAKFCRGFREEALKNIAPNATAPAFLEALIKERAGACRHRSFVFMHLMQQKYPDVPVRLVSNAVHMFVEVYSENTWVTCDLGGYPAHVQVNERGLPEYQPGKKSKSNPIEVYKKTLSDTGEPLARDFFKKAQNLTTLDLKECSKLPMHDDLSMLDTLNIISCPLTAERLQKFLILAPNIKTLRLKNCIITPEEFSHLDFSCLPDLEHVKLSGRFIPDMKSLTRLMQTAPKARWIIESDNLSLEHTNPMVGSEEDQPLPDMEIRKKPRPLPSRYFTNRNRHLTAKKRAFDILKPSKHPTSVRKTLINAVDAEAARFVLQKTAASLQQEHYYVDSPAALRCAGPYIRRHGHLGHIENGAGGPLYDFIMSNPDTPKNIIINYDAFGISDFTSFNNLLDDPATLDGIPLPPTVHIIGLLNQHNPKAYQGADFYSRFDAFESMTNNEKTWPTLKPFPLTEQTTTTKIIELCGGEQWEARLIGHWLLQEGRLFFKEGLLLEALNANKSSFSFNHAPLHDPQFVRFLHDLTLHDRIIHQGHDYGPLPDNFNVVLTEGVYIPEKERLLTLSPEGELTPDHVMLNQANQNDFLGSYCLDEKTRQLIFQSGLIEQYKNKMLPVFLTSSLSFYTWLKLLEACRKHQTVLQVTLAPNVTLPKELEVDTAQITKRPRLPSTPNTAFNPPVLPDNPDIIIDVSELEPDDLLATFKNKGFNATSHQFQFTPIKIYPWEALKTGKTVVLKGKWNQKLADAVQTVMFKRMQQDKPSGQLIIFSDTPQQFNAFPQTPIPDALKIAPKTHDQHVDYENRLDAVEAVLKNHPFVLLTGATGVGKTHFVSRTWKAAHPVCYYGEKQITAFLENQSPDDVITLYINEANLANKQWSLFEGLFTNPPAIFYNNHYYSITSRHKIIFDGNPISYGGERHTPGLFQNHPCQLHFKPLPREVISSMTGLDDALSRPVLEVVMYMTTLNPDDTLLTPREIKMMGSLVKTGMARYPHIPPETLARYFAYTLCKNHVPPPFQNEFEMRFKMELPFHISDVTATPEQSDLPDRNQPHYLLNNTNLPVAIALESHLMVREDRRKQISNQSLETGLGGLVIEGESGEGKSLLILNQMAAHGYKKDSDFIHIPAKSKPNEIREKLLKGFHDGLIVVMDEINSLPLPEQLLNAILEGHDLDDKPAEKPGFLLLGTQNPITYRGRLKLTSPLEHRLQKVVLPTSTLLEKQHILEKIGLPSRITQDILGEYSHQYGLSFRDVIKIAKQWLKHHQDQPAIQLDIIPVKQMGSLCKTVAIANVENYYAKKLDYPSIPLWSEQQKRISIRKCVKANGSSQGEILEFEQWRKTFDDLGFTSESVDFHENINHFVATITDNLKQDNLPLIAFPVDKDSGLPNPEPREPEASEHAAVISGYDWKTDEFTLVHWGKTYVADAVTLFNATHKLVDTRSQEFYIKNPAYQQSKKWEKKKYLPTTDPDHPHIARTSIIPKKNTGFKAKLLIVQAPDKTLLLQKRQNLVQQPEATGEKPGLFKRKYEDAFKNKAESSIFAPKK